MFLMNRGFKYWYYLLIMLIFRFSIFIFSNLPLFTFYDILLHSSRTKDDLLFNLKK